MTAKAHYVTQDSCIAVDANRYRLGRVHFTMSLRVPVFHATLRAGLDPQYAADRGAYTLAQEA